MNMLRWMVISLLVALASGCASVPDAAQRSTQDPWEGFNRKVFSFNDKVDEALLKPVAEGYVKVVPEPIRAGVRNALGNVGDIWSAANHLLQGKVQTSAAMGARVLANTTIGLGGLLDPATSMGLERHSEDFGQTLGHWGVGTGPYLVMPLLGPSTVRDGIASIGVDRLASPSALASADAVSYSLLALDVVNGRAELLGVSQMLDSIALDKYSFVRQAYLARRLNAVHDGSPPLQIPEDEPLDSVSEPGARPPSSPASQPPSLPAPKN